VAVQQGEPLPLTADAVPGPLDAAGAAYSLKIRSGNCAPRHSLPARLNGYLERMHGVYERLARVSLKKCRDALEIIDAYGRFRAGGRAGRAGPRRSP
jgi:hypothetical protein